ncbi:uronate isomerase [Mucilaginibacter sp. PAMC 26640]|nr:uronate isomerase [Mucilaginibacter sp. PAMC 26640]
MKTFLNEDFLLQSNTAKQLYHDYAAPMPIIDYHCHLPPGDIANDINFDNLTAIWLHGDHYKWRAMRTNGVDESFITGGRSDREKFEQWAATVPYTLRNPLYHWTHLELQRYFNIDSRLMPSTADDIYADCTAKLQTPQYRVRSLITKMNVEVICTTDDPIDHLEYHKKIRNDNFETKVFPAFRPDKAMNSDNIPAFNTYINQLEKVADMDIGNFYTYISALKKRHNYFAINGCTVSDHGIDQMYAEDCTEKEAGEIFGKIRGNQPISNSENVKFKSFMLHQFAIWDYEKGWVQQYHIGAIRNNSTRGFRQSGADTGRDSIGDFHQGKSLSRFLDKLDADDKLAKTIIYNINPADNELMATMAGNFNDGSIAGKIQWGSAWWFLDQKDGMTKQLNALSNMGLISRMVGMLTDSRSFLSFPRHEYFRRILCNLFAEDIENGELPNDIQWTGKIIRDICYFNAKNYFDFDKK